MPSADNENTAAVQTEQSFPLFDIEDVLVDMKSDIDIIRHLANADDVACDTWRSIAERLYTAQDRLKDLFTNVCDQHAKERKAAKAALAAAETKRAAPGSLGDLAHAEMLWRALRAIAEGVIDACDNTKTAGESS